MASPPPPFPFILFLLLLFSASSKVSQCVRTFTIINYCRETVWPAVMPAGDDDAAAGGSPLRTGQSVVFNAPLSWSGRIWGRTGCNFDRNNNNNNNNNGSSSSCETGDCGPNLRCGGSSGKPPASLAEFTVGAVVDYYDVSLVDGFNLPMIVRPINGRGNCSTIGCDGDLRRGCPKELSVKGGNGNGRTVGCRSACDVFNTDEYCCRGVYGNPVTCKPTYYSQQFKKVCPTAYSYAYDDPTSIFTCSGTDYIISFCSSSRRQPVCTYHDNRLMCSGSSMRMRGKWWMIIILALLITKYLLCTT